MQENLIFPIRRSVHMIYRLDRASSCFVNRISVFSKPCSDLTHALCHIRTDMSVFIRSHIQKQVAVACHHIHQHVDQPVKIRNRIVCHPAPGTAAAYTHIFLPRHRDDLSRDLMRTFITVEIAFPAGTWIHDHLGIIFPCHFVQFHRLPEPGTGRIASLMCQPASVVPENVNFPIIADQFPDLIVALFLHQKRIVCIGRIFLSFWIKISRESPVHRRIIQTDSQARLSGTVCIFFYKITV